MVKVDYRKVAYWQVEKDNVKLYDIKGKQLDTLSVDGLVQNWLEWAKIRKLGKVI